ncbi:MULTISPECIES: hypothetical protein [unclassified Streptomyces]|uniref:hypothetical protein n=1 Tax=unclassified Streptomyces TaxID=2593676 RepID=UPI000DBA66CA|nr:MULTISPECIES: hypothetical protein [unclassified Streptomyces]MYT73797.1 hypothetical protein [Streptomyces sp. SID8367]RAJ89208.1 hypothetical protein K377_01333 [Streptomyces sp. PsTaAH-137]
MALFNRKKPEPVVEPRPVSVGEKDLQAAAALLPRFLAAVDDRGVRQGALAIAQAAGAPTMQEAVLAQMRTGDSGIDRPWRWLRAVGRQAHRQGDDDLVVHVVLFSLYWMLNIQPTAGLADHQDMRMDDPPADILADLYALALEALPGHDPDRIVIDHPTGTVTVDSVLVGCAAQALTLRDRLPDALVERARRYAS